MYEYEMKVSERKAITVCMGMKCKKLSVSAITAMYEYEMEES